LCIFHFYKKQKEIVPITVTIKDKKAGTERQVTVTKDEGIREGMKLADVAKLGNTIL